MYHAYFVGSVSYFFLQPGSQKKYFFPLYSLVSFAALSSIVNLQTGSIALRYLSILLPR